MVINKSGIIIDANSAWVNFGIENGISSRFSWHGRNYLEPLSSATAAGDSFASAATQGIMAVLAGEQADYHL